MASQISRLGNKAVFSAKGQGSRRAWVEGFEYGTSINMSEGQSKFGSTVYPREVTGSSFDLAMAFSSYDEWEDFNTWISKVIDNISSGHTFGLMVVMIPDLGWARIGIPSKGITFGDSNSAVARKHVLSFEGASDPLDPGDLGTTSEPMLPNDWIARKFFPTGDQGKGAVEEGISLFQSIVADMTERAEGSATKRHSTPLPSYAESVAGFFTPPGGFVSQTSASSEWSGATDWLIKALPKDGS